MNLPLTSFVERKLLLLLNRRGRPLEPTEVYRPLADDCSLTSLQRHAILSENDKRNAWENRVQWARATLVKKGFLDNSQYGLWSLTPAGRAEAARLEAIRPLTLDDF